MINWINGEYFMAALAQWAACLVYISTQKKRFRPAATAAISAGMLAVQLFVVWICTHHLGFAEPESLLLHLLKACFYILIMGVHMLLTCRISLLMVCIRSLVAFMAAELAWGVAMFGHYLIITNMGTLSFWMRWGTVVLIYVVILGLFLLIEYRITVRLGTDTGSVRELILTFLVTMVCYALSNLQLIFMGNNWGDLWDKTLGNIPRMTFVLIGLFFLYGRRIWQGYLQIRQELEMINGVIEKQKGQYEFARVNAEAINQKYHDLKNQIAIIKADIPADKQKEWLESLEKKVEQIEPERLTGHPVLDTIFWEKKQFCMLHDIQLSYVMDGKLFENIDMDDLCVVFGGALDNAIEAVMKIEDRERRLIHVKAMQQQGFLVICVENINDSPLEYEDGRLSTTKKDKTSHGYGLKGIRYVAEKYGGNISIVQEDEWFRLTVFLHESVNQYSVS